MTERMEDAFGYTLRLRQTKGGRYSIDRHNISTFCDDECYTDAFPVVSGLATIETANLYAAKYVHDHPGHRDPATLRKATA